jgi:hypothetical protein
MMFPVLATAISNAVSIRALLQRQGKLQISSFSQLVISLTLCVNRGVDTRRGKSL